MAESGATFAHSGCLNFLGSFSAFYLGRGCLARGPATKVDDLKEGKGGGLHGVLPPRALTGIDSCLGGRGPCVLLTDCVLCCYFVQPTRVMKLELGSVDLGGRAVFMSSGVSGGHGSNAVALPSGIVRLVLSLRVFGGPNSCCLFSSKFHPNGAGESRGVFQS